MADAADHRRPFDARRAAELLGKHLLIGVNYEDHHGKLIEQKQFHGDIVRINEGEGIVVALRPSGEEFKLPPDLRSVTEARQGEYRLRSTGEVVVDPDLVTSWTSTKAAPSGSRDEGKSKKGKKG